MTALAERKALRRFAVVTAGHEFLLNVLPLREPDSRAAVLRFITVVERSELPLAEVDAVLLRCLAVLDMQGHRIPSLVEQYLGGPFASQSPPLERFNACIEGLLRHQRITHGSVQQALEIIADRISDSRLSPRAIADETGVRLATLDVAFKRQTGRTVTERIRTTRLEHAAFLLATTGDSVKEIWSRVGYNHASNFAHDFKRHFGVSPQVLRARAIRPLAQQRWSSDRASDEGAAGLSQDGGVGVMIVDDNEQTTATIDIYLRREGYSVVVAPTGAAGLEQAKRQLPAAILVDYHLEDMTGLQFVRELRQRVPGDTPGIGIFTADWDVFDQAEDIYALNAIAASKLCDLDQVKNLVTYLSVSPRSLCKETRFW